MKYFYKEMIVEKGLKQRWIAKQINVDEGDLSRFIRGKGNLPKHKVQMVEDLLFG
ncbi:hypothetical protein [Ammoniphilus resinae]|uniref:XRE-type DNA-binding protein n=1 Tax=Ammoniphilus resinae TaxID=861532 RepID=A0ABS4GYB9_9BACL|nr:hypothetical protein [Ammoniphilus resinae]MBP1935032.1 putative XRE-type DNA-binding protein [Ammoniphilus resinae]